MSIYGTELVTVRGALNFTQSPWGAHDRISTCNFMLLVASFPVIDTTPEAYYWFGQGRQQICAALFAAINSRFGNPMERTHMPIIGMLKYEMLRSHPDRAAVLQAAKEAFLYYENQDLKRSEAAAARNAQHGAAATAVDRAEMLPQVQYQRPVSQPTLQQSVETAAVPHPYQGTTVANPGESTDHRTAPLAGGSQHLLPTVTPGASHEEYIDLTTGDDREMVHPPAGPETHTLRPVASADGLDGSYIDLTTEDEDSEMLHLSAESEKRTLSVQPLVRMAWAGRTLTSQRVRWVGRRVSHPSPAGMRFTLCSTL